MMVIVTLTELGAGKYTADFLAHNRRRRYLLTAGMREALKARGRVVWATARFGWGHIGEQKQFEVVGKGE